MPRAFRKFETGPDAVNAGPLVVFDFEGRSITAAAGLSVAAALLVAGVIEFRSTPASGSKRGPYCMMGACFDCLVEIDARDNQQACMTLIRAGMQVRRMRGAAGVQVAPSVTSAADAPAACVQANDDD